MCDQPEIWSTEEAHDGIELLALFAPRICCWRCVFDVGDRACVARTAAAALVLLPEEVVRNDDSREEDDDGNVVYDDKQRREQAEARNAEHGRRCTHGKRDGCCERCEEHGAGRLSVAVRKAMRERLVLVLSGVLPRVEEDEDVIGADAEQYEDGEHMEYSEVAEVEHNAIYEIGAEESGQDAEDGPPGHPKGSSLDEQEQHDEEKAAHDKRHVEHDHGHDEVEQQRHTAVEELHIADTVRKVLLSDWLEVVNGERLNVTELILVPVGDVLVAFERHAKVEPFPDDGGMRLGGVDCRLLAERVIQGSPCVVIQPGGVQHPDYFVKIGVIEDGVDRRVGAVKESQHWLRLHAVVWFTLTSQAETLLELFVQPELVLDFFHCHQVFLCEHVSFFFFEE